MKAKSIILVAVLFLFMGIVFLGCGIFLKLQKKNKNLFAKSAGKTFSLLGIITLVYGILAICFRNELTKLVAEIFAIICLLVIIILIVIFNIKLNKSMKNKEG